MKVKILHDPEHTYKDNEILEASELIESFIQGLTDNKDDTETKEWLHKASQKSAVELVAAMWDLSIEIQ
jgi:hypothetical protein